MPISKGARDVSRGNFLPDPAAGFAAEQAVQRGKHPGA